MSEYGRPPDNPDDGMSEMPTRRLTIPSPLAIQVEGRTHPGQVRSGNEDSLAVEAPDSARARSLGTLLVVSDGMGGHAAGEVASRIAVDTVTTVYYRNQAGHSAGPDWTGHVVESLVGAIADANAAIYAEAANNPDRSGMGCTIVAAVTRAEDLVVAHVGDSRAYLVRNGRIQRLTRDHSWVAQQVDEGILTPEQAERHPHRSLLTRALGRDTNIQVDATRHTLRDGDALLLCSDGLTSVVHDAEIAELIGRLPPGPAAERLIALANERGAPDNVTVVVAGASDGLAALAPTVTRLPAAVDRLSDAPTETMPVSLATRPVRTAPLAPLQPARRPLWPFVAGLVALGVLALLGYVLLLRPDSDSEATTPRATSTSTPAAARATSTPVSAVAGVAGSAPGSPPPIPTGIPGLAAAASPPASAAGPVAAAASPAAAAPTVAPTLTPLPTVTAAATATLTPTATNTPTPTATPPAAPSNGRDQPARTPGGPSGEQPPGEPPAGEQPPSGEAPADGAGPGGEAPPEGMAPSDAPASDAPAGDAPASDAPAGDAPASDAPASDMPPESPPDSEAPPAEPPPAPPPAAAPRPAPRAAPSGGGLPSFIPPGITRPGGRRNDNN